MTNVNMMVKVQFQLCVESAENGDGLWFEMDWVLPCPPMGIENFSFCNCCSPYPVAKNIPIYYEVHNERFIVQICLDWEHTTSANVREHFLSTGWHETEWSAKQDIVQANSPAAPSN